MSRNEALSKPKNPLEYEQGLSVQEDLKLRGIIKAVQKARNRRADSTRRTYSMSEENTLAAQSRRLYHKNKGQFQVQAVKDAAAEDVHTTFGSS